MCTKFKYISIEIVFENSVVLCSGGEHWESGARGRGRNRGWEEQGASVWPRTHWLSFFSGPLSNSDNMQFEWVIEIRASSGMPGLNRCLESP